MKNKPRLIDIYEDRFITQNERKFGQWRPIPKKLRYQRPIHTLSPGRRFINLFIDCAFFGGMLLLFEGFSHVAFYPIFYLFGIPLYYIIGEFFLQKTLGKLFTRSLVVDVYGEKPNLRKIILRTSIRFIPFEPFSFLNEDRGWHDQWSETYVISEDELKTVKALMADAKNMKP